eukprot:6149907-Pyramimonas_sp.AAC.1
MHHEGRTGEELNDSMRKACLRSMCPNTLSDHIDMRVARLDARASLMTEVERCIELVQVRIGPVPMDIGTLARGGKDTKEGKGK